MSGPLEAILDEGAVGLRFFDRVVPWRDEAGGTGPSYLDLCARYDAQRGLDTDVLRADAARCRDVATTLRAELAARTEAATGLTTVWTGAAATAAADVLAAQSTRASLDVDHLELAASTLDRAAEGLRAIVQDKAVAAADHDRRDFAGRDLDDAHATVVGATQDPSTWSVDTVDRLTALVPELGAAAARGPVALWERPEVVDAVVTACRNWVDGVFLPAVDEATTSFDDLCSESHAAIERIFDVVDAALDDLCTDPYPTVADSVTLPTEPLPTTPAAAEQCVGPSGTGSSSAPAVAAPEQPGPAAPAGSVVPTVPAVSAAPASVSVPAASVPDASVNAVSDERLADVVRTAVAEAVSLVLSSDEGAVETPCESAEVRPVSEPERGSEPGARSPIDATPASDLGRVEAGWAGHRARLEVHADGSIEFRAGPVAGSEPTQAPPVDPAEPPVDRASPVAPAPLVDPAPPVDPAPLEPTPVDAPPPQEAPADCVPDAPAAAPSVPPGPSPEPPVEPASDPVAGPRPALAEAGPL